MQACKTDVKTNMMMIMMMMMMMSLIYFFSQGTKDYQKFKLNIFGKKYTDKLG